jgi:succinoglycan biosynthesis transport protein ExoP
VVEHSNTAPSAAAEPTYGYLRVLRRRFWVIALSALLVGASALAFSNMQDKEYTATSSLLFRSPDLGTKIANPNALQSTGDPFRDAATNRALVSLRVVADLTAQKLGARTTGKDVQNHVDVKQEAQSDVVTVSARARSPRAAQRLASTFTRTYIAFRQKADVAAIRKAQALVEKRLRAIPRRNRDGPLGRALSDRADELAVLASLQTGNAQLAQPADLPSAASSPKPARNALLGLAAGILLGVALAFSVDRLDPRLKDTAEVQQLLDGPLLGTVPSSRSLAKCRPSATDNAVFAVLQANLRYFDLGKDLHSVLVTSAAARDGKTTVAWNLAAAAADSGRRVLLIEADLRKRDVANWYQPKKGRSFSRSPLPRESRGLTNFLAEHADWRELVRTILFQRLDGTGFSYDLLPAGATPPNPTALLASPQMSHLMSEAELDYDLVVIDGTPITLLSDAVGLVPDVDGVIAVTHLANTPRRAVIQLREQLEHLRPNIVAVVVNGADRTKDYGRYYNGSPIAGQQRRAAAGMAVTGSEGEGMPDGSYSGSGPDRP